MSNLHTLEKLWNWYLYDVESLSEDEVFDLAQKLFPIGSILVLNDIYDDDKLRIGEVLEVVNEHCIGYYYRLLSPLITVNGKKRKSSPHFIALVYLLEVLWRGSGNLIVNELGIGWCSYKERELKELLQRPKLKKSEIARRREIINRIWKRPLNNNE